MMKNDWLIKEVNSLKTEIKEGKNRGDKLFPYLMAMVIFLLFATSSMHACCCSTNQNAGFFPNTWVCPNQNCRYENYEGINYCAICGTKRN
jgi:hypothetical protein